MNGIRRTALLLALVLAPVLGTLGPAHPAQASFSEKVAAPTVQVTTASVAPPANVVGSLTCGRSSATMALNWAPSTSAQVSTYVVRVYFNDGFVQVVDPLPATATSWSAPMSLYTAQNYYIQYSVTTHTSYGWTTESPRTAWFTC